MPAFRASRRSAKEMSSIRSRSSAAILRMSRSEGSPTRVEIGDNNVFREGVTVHRGSEKEQGVTRIGSNNLLMVNVHVAHDCVIDDRVIIANNTILGGHGHVESFVTVSGGVGIHPFVSIGSYSYVGAFRASIMTSRGS